MAASPITWQRNFRIDQVNHLLTGRGLAKYAGTLKTAESLDRLAQFRSMKGDTQRPLPRQPSQPAWRQRSAFYVSFAATIFHKFDSSTDQFCGGKFSERKVGFQPEGDTPQKFADGAKVVKRPAGKRTSALDRFWPQS